MPALETSDQLRAALGQHGNNTVGLARLFDAEAGMLARYLPRFDAAGQRVGSDVCAGGRCHHFSCSEQKFEHALERIPPLHRELAMAYARGDLKRCAGELGFSERELRVVAHRAMTAMTNILMQGPAY